MSAEQKNAAVLAVLNAATEPLGPTEIARRVSQPWCIYEGRDPNSSAIVAVLRRIGAVRHNGGEYTSPATGEAA